MAQWLPGGRRDGHEWRCGSLRGDAGQSCSVNLVTGAWADFATGEKGGDLVSLFAAVFGRSQGEAARELAEDLGVGELPRAPAAAPASPKPRTDWVPVLPVPPEAGLPPVAHVARGRPEATWTYRDEAGLLLGYVCRFRTSDGGKEVLPLTFTRHADTGAQEWRWVSFRPPRPLYGLDRLTRPGAVLVVEGEKCADAAQPHWPGPVVSWPGGCKADGKAEFGPLAGREVILWPDADAHAGKDGELLPAAEQPGMAVMLRIARRLQAGGAASVRVMALPAPGARTDGWDVADALAEGMTGAQMRAYVLETAQPLPGEPAAAGGGGASTLSGAAAGGGGGGEGWRSNLIRAPRGGLADCRENVMLALMHHPDLRGLVARDEFAGRARRMRSPEWGGGAGEWTPVDDRELGLWMAQRLGLLIKSETTVAAGVEMAAQRAAFHPVHDYLRKLRWDGTERLDHWLVDCLGVAETEYARRAGRLFVLSMVARVMRPGCKADHMLVLEGPQGQGKSSALRVLAGEWFSDAPFRVGDKDSFLQMEGVWLYEIAELDSFSRAETTAVKAFVTQVSDRFREPYGRRVILRERQTVLAGTTNQDRYLRDVTGNRRFWPVMVGQLDLAKLTEWRDQLFAEAVAAFDAGERWYPGREEEARLFVPEQDQRSIEDPWIDVIARRLGEPEALLNDEYTASEILGLIGVTADKIDSAGLMAKRVQAAMTQLGWGKPRRVYRDDGTRPNAYRRPPRAAQGSALRVHDDEVPL